MEAVTDKKQSFHEKKTRSSKTAARATRRQTTGKSIEETGFKKAGPGRPKGSTIDKKWRLTERQMDIARQILEAELDGGLFPASIGELVAVLDGVDRRKLTDLLRRDNFQAYMQNLMEVEGFVLETTFWRGLALGLQVGDVKVLELYAKMTGKLVQKKESKLVVEVKGPAGMPMLPEYPEIIDVEIIEEEE